MIIGDTQFEFVDAIEPDRDSHGHIVEHSPASRYANRAKLPLNKYGEGPFCRFRIQVIPFLDTVGVYAITEGNKKVLYIGKCTGTTSTLAKRFNYGYGSIQPRNCYKRGQSTNCRINRLVLESVKNGEGLSLFFHKCKDSQDATGLETRIISIMDKPPWNIQEPFPL